MPDWLSRYLTALPHWLRTNPTDERLLLAADTAERNGWRPDDAAARVAAANYEGKVSPPRIAVMNLADMAAYPPRSIHDQAPRQLGCTACVEGWIDRDDGTSTTPCRTCRPGLYTRLRHVPPPGQRTAADLHRMRTVTE